MFRKSLCLSLAVAAAVLAAAEKSSTVGAVPSLGQTAKLFVGATAPGNAVYRYDVGVTGTPTLDLTLTDPTFATPGFFAFSPGGEMFVVNNLGGVSRFLDPGGIPVFNGSITSNNFGNLHWATFSGDELFIVNPLAGGLSRLTFDAAGNAVPNGTIGGALGPGVVANPGTGELFASAPSDTVRRFVLDASGNAVPNGSITGNGLFSPHDLAFSPWGELFVVNGFGNSISRFVLDAAGNASANGVITEGTLHIPLGVAFSPWGELFVANRNDGVISRWVFDASSNATFNGTIQHHAGIHDLAFAPSAVQVEIDIMPGGDPNSIPVMRPGDTPVAILGTADFDASGIAPSTVAFGPSEVGPTHEAGHIEDVNGDGYPDLLLHFATRETGIACGDTSAFLTGEMNSGQAVEGADSVQPVPCR